VTLASTPSAGHPLAGAFDALYLACIWVAGIAITVMSLIIPVGVFMRYVLEYGAQWPEPIAILLMVVFTFVGAAAAYRAGGHIAVAMLTDALPPPVGRIVARLVELLMLLVCGFVVWYGSRLCVGTMGQTIAELPWMPVGITYLAIPIGSLATLLFVLEHMVWGSQAQREVVRFGEVH
jgi:TRAP-type C4-dicarboxylate transport system permease small subunit